MIIKKFGVDFYSSGGALTLKVKEVSAAEEESGTHERTHPSGWTIKGEVKEDFFTWVNEFEASHPRYGRVWGNFEDEVNADSESAFQNFWQNHEPYAWDYADI